MKSDKEGNDKAPDYRISGRDEDDFVEVGACWKKVDKNGNSYLSCKLRDEYKDKPGYEIVKEGGESVVDEIKREKASRKPQDAQIDEF